MSGSPVVLRGAAVIAVCAAACSYNPAPVPLVGIADEIYQLAGEWAGEYWSGETGRSGSILFTLQAGADTACGDVLMVPEGLQPAVADPAPGRTPELIGIRFVRVAEGSVRGRLEPYRDPACGCRLETTFDGEIHGDTIRGAFSSRHLETGLIQRGRWRVIRKT